MTNAEKFLKDGKVTEELIGEMETSLCVPYCEVASFWNKQIKPTLTDDERVILRNINANYIDTIRRNSFGELILHYAGTDNEVELHYFKKELFQFIKERRTI